MGCVRVCACTCTVRACHWAARAPSCGRAGDMISRAVVRKASTRRMERPNTMSALSSMCAFVCARCVCVCARCTRSSTAWSLPSGLLMSRGCGGVGSGAHACTNIIRKPHKRNLCQIADLLGAACARTRARVLCVCATGLRARRSCCRKSERCVGDMISIAVDGKSSTRRMELSNS
jgi:hypothetical protein